MKNILLKDTKMLELLSLIIIINVERPRPPLGEVAE